MKPSESTQLLRKIGAMWPSMTITDDTIKVWATELKDTATQTALQNLDTHANSDQALWPPSLPMIKRGPKPKNHVDHVMNLNWRRRLELPDFPDKRSYTAAMSVRRVMFAGVAESMRRAYLAAWNELDGFEDTAGGLALSDGETRLEVE